MDWLRGRWSRLPRFARAVVMNLLIGLAIEAVLLALHGSRLMVSIEDAGLDWMIGMYAATPPVGRRPAIPFTVLDIDDDTYRVWGEPLLIPRDKLLALIRFAVDRGAKLVIVDVDLSRSSDPAQDRALSEYLEWRKPGQEVGGAHSPRPDARVVPIIFIRTFHAPPGRDGARQARASILDGILDSAPGVYMSAPLFEMDRDLAIRRWRLWEPTCGSRFGDVVPSVQLLMLMLSVSQPAGMDETLLPVRRYACRYRLGTAAAGPYDGRVQVGPVWLSLDQPHLRRRIVYTLPWKLGGYPTVSTEGHRTPVLISLPAYVVSETPAAVSAEAVAGRAVIIGGSFADGRDVYATPLGPMPGAWVIVNAVQSLLQFGELRYPPAWVKLFVLAGVIVLVSVLFAWLRSFFAMLACGVIILVLLLPASLWLFRAGVWLEFAIPLLAVLGHHLYDQVEEAKHAGIRASSHLGARS